MFSMLGGVGWVGGFGPRKKMSPLGVSVVVHVSDPGKG